MPSAYDTQGRLKKHALLGTSFAVDPTQAAQRSKFQTLHEEAKLAAGTGAGREEMLNRLEGRWKEYGNEQLSRLEQLAVKKGDIQAQANALYDPEQEFRYQEFERWMGYPSAVRTKAKKLSDLTSAGIPSSFVEEVRTEWDALGKAGQRFYQKTNKAKHGLVDYVKDLWQERYGTPAQQAYKEQISAEIDKLNRQMIPVQEEEMARQEKMNDRMELYNMFLGME